MRGGTASPSRHCYRKTFRVFKLLPSRSTEWRRLIMRKAQDKTSQSWAARSFAAAIVLSAMLNFTAVALGQDNSATGWSPDGRQLAFVMRDPATDEEDKAAKGKDDSRWVDENVKMNRLYVMNLEKDASGKRDPKKLTSGDYNVDGDFNWAPDGKFIAF